MMKLFMVFLLISCAAGSYTIKQSELLPYKESSQITKLNQKNKAIVFDVIEDHRQDKSLGFAYTGVEYKKTPLLMDANIQFMLKNQLTSGFEMRNVLLAQTGTLKLSVFIKEMKVYEVIERMKPERAACKLSLEFSLDGENEKWAGRFSTQFTSAGDGSDGTERLAPTLASCINDLVEKVVSDEKFVKLIREQ